jgi:hypothetical protein
MVSAQVDAYLAKQAACPHCGGRHRLKGRHEIVVRSLFGTLRLGSPRLRHCSCQESSSLAAAKSFSPLDGQVNANGIRRNTYRVTRRCEEDFQAEQDIEPRAEEWPTDNIYRRGSYRFEMLSGFWAPLSGVQVEGYEIRHGKTVPVEPSGSSFSLRSAVTGNCGWQHGQTLALYAHGLFENTVTMQTLFGQQSPTLNDTLDGLADVINAHVGERQLMSLIE